MSWWLGVVVAGSSVVTFAAIPSARQYDVIANRNVFGLRAPEKAPAPEPMPVNAPPVFLTGITTLLGYKQALLRVQVTASPGQPAREESLILAEGQRENGIEVLRIDERAGQVSILNGGGRMTLNFDRNGIQAKGGLGSPTVLAQNPGTATNPTTYRLLPSRTPRGRYAAATNIISAPLPSPTGYPRSYLYAQTNSLPTGVSTDGASPLNAPVPTQTAPAPASTLTPQEQAVLSELRRAALMESVNQPNPNPGTEPVNAYPEPPDLVVPGPVRPAVPPFPPQVGY